MSPPVFDISPLPDTLPVFSVDPVSVRDSRVPVLIAPVAASVPVEIRAPVITSGGSVSPPVFVVPVEIGISIPLFVPSGGAQESSVSEIVRITLSL